MTDIRKTFVLATPVARAWELFTDGAERSQWEADVYDIDPVEGGKFHWELPGLACDGTVDEVVPLQFLRQSENTGPHSHTQVTVTFEEVEGGTRITVTQSGFGDADPWQSSLGGADFGWDQAIADLQAYVRTGVPARRFTVALADPGMRVGATPAGLEVLEVRPGGCADSAGMRAGDLILTAAGAPVYSYTELWVVLRQRGPGAVMEFEYARGGARHAGAGTLTLLGG